MARKTQIFHGTTKVFVPWFDSNKMKQWSILTFTGDAEAEKVFQEVRKFIRHNFKKRITTKWIMTRCRIWNSEEHEATVKSEWKRKTASDEAVEEWIERIQSNEDEDERNPVCEGAASNKAELPVQSVPDTGDAR